MTETHERRPWGTGTVSKHRDGFRARLPGEKRGDVGTFPTREKADDALGEALDQLEVAPIEAETFAAWGARWLGERGVREGTLARDRSRWRTYVAESDLGAQRVGAVTAGDVERWLVGMSELAAQTRQNALGLVKGALKAEAKERGVVSVAASVTLPKNARARKDTGWDWLRPREIGAVIASPLLPKQRAFFTLAMFSGLRAGELCGLRWDCVDFERGVIHVVCSRADAPKNGRPREVPMMAPARAALERWREHYVHEGIRSHLGLVFPAPDGGYHDDGYDADWPEVRAIAGIVRPVRFHDLRHTYASHMLQGTWVSRRWVARALRLEEVKELLGHADIKTTQRYSHLSKDGVAALFTPSESAGPVLDLGTCLGTGRKPPRRFELRTYGLRNRERDPSAHEESATSEVSVPSLVPSLRTRLALARDRLVAALTTSDPWRDRRAAELAEVVDDLLDAADAPPADDTLVPTEARWRNG